MFRKVTPIMSMTLNNKKSAEELKETILSIVQEARNLTPSEIVLRIYNILPHYSHHEVKHVVKEMQQECKLVHDIIYGGLKVA